MKIKRNNTKKKHNIIKTGRVGYSGRSIRIKGSKPDKKVNKSSTKNNKHKLDGTTIVQTGGLSPLLQQLTKSIESNSFSYTNNKAPYLQYYTTGIKELTDLLYNNINGIPEFLGNSNSSNFIHERTIIKTFIGDTFHDLCQNRGHTSADLFNDNIIKEILNTNKDFPNILNTLFANTIRKSHLEPDINTYVEMVFKLRPAYNEVTFDDIIRLYKEPNPQVTGFEIRESIRTIIIRSNGSLKIIFPNNMTANEFMASKWGENHRHEILYICDFIKRYLHQNDNLMSSLIGDTDNPLVIITHTTDIRFLFDAGTSHIGKFFRTKGSRGIRVVGMASTHDSASSSSESLELKNEYISHNNNVANKLQLPTSGYVPEHVISTNLFTSHIIRMSLKEQDDKIFGKDGIHCFNLSIQRINGPSCMYKFGPKRDNYYTKNTDENDPCGFEGASVPYLQNLFTLYEKRKIKSIDIDTEIKRNNFTHIPMGDSRLHNLFNTDGNFDYDNFYRLLADYKRTGDYEQALTLLKQITLEEKNANNYTFSTGDLLSSLFARLNGIPTVYQVASAGYLTLYSSNILTATPEQRQLAEEKREQKEQKEQQEQQKQKRILLYDKFMSVKNYFTKDKPFDTISKLLKEKKITDKITKLLLYDVIQVFTDMQTIINLGKDNVVDNDDSFNKMTDMYTKIISKYPNLFVVHNVGGKFGWDFGEKKIFKETKINLELLSTGVDSRVNKLNKLYNDYIYNKNRSDNNGTGRHAKNYIAQTEHSERNYEISKEKLISSLYKTEYQGNIKQFFIDNDSQSSQQLKGGGNITIPNHKIITGGGGMIGGNQKNIELQFSVMNIVNHISTKCFDYLKSIVNNNFRADIVDYSESNTEFLMSLNMYLRYELDTLLNTYDYVDYQSGSAFMLIYDLLYLLNARIIYENTYNDMFNEHGDYDVNTLFHELQENRTYFKNIFYQFITQVYFTDTYTVNYLGELFLSNKTPQAIKKDRLDNFDVENIYQDIFARIDSLVIKIVSLFSVMIKKSVNSEETINFATNVPPEFESTLIGADFERYYTLSSLSLIWVYLENEFKIDLGTGVRTRSQVYSRGGNKTRKKRKNKKQGGTKRVREGKIM